MKNFTHKVIRQEHQDGTVKHRDIYVPSKEAREMGKTVVHILNDYHADIHTSHATGSIPGKSVMHNVLPHAQSQHFVMYDLKDAYVNADTSHIIDVLKRPGIFDGGGEITKGLLHTIYEMCVLVDDDGVVNGFPPGAPASPVLFNVANIPLDEQLGQYCQSENIIYTRYLDDLTFSSTKPIGKNRRRQLREIIDNYSGAVINNAKTKVHSLDYGPVTITGLSIYPNGRRIQPNPNFIAKLKDVFSSIENVADQSQAEDLDENFSTLFPSSVLIDPVEYAMSKLSGYRGAALTMGYSSTKFARETERDFWRIMRKIGTLQEKELYDFKADLIRKNYQTMLTDELLSQQKWGNDEDAVFTIVHNMTQELADLRSDFDTRMSKLKPQ
jgi:hypothetical protein